MEWPLKDLLRCSTCQSFSPLATVVSPTSTLPSMRVTMVGAWCLHGGELVVLANRPSDEMTMKSDVTENVIKKSVWVSNVSSEVEFPTKLKQRLRSEIYRKFYTLLLPFVLFKEEMLQKETLGLWHENYSLLQHEGIFAFAPFMRAFGSIRREKHAAWILAHYVWCKHFINSKGVLRACPFKTCVVQLIH